MDVLPHGGYPDGRRLGRVPGRVGQQVAQDLDDALPVRQHPRQVRWQVDAERISAPSAQVHVSGLIHDGRKLQGSGVTDSLPVSMCAASSRALISSRM